jgi:hypothetical protein
MSLVRAENGIQSRYLREMMRELKREQHIEGSWKALLIEALETIPRK